MWSHYAENHSGVCIQFELARDPRFLLEAMSVKYSDEFPEVNWFDEQMSEQLASTILNKHTGWQYEQEHRIVHIDKAGDFLKFKPEAISGIIIGAKLSPQKLERLHEILKERQEAGHPQIKIWRAQLAETRYKLAIFSEKKS